MSPISTPPGPTPEQDLLPEPESSSAPSAPLVPSNPDAPLTFIPHTPEGAVGNQPVRIRTGRYGILEEHELVRLLDTIEDERARGRFRESIYISIFVWLAIAGLVLYGPRYLWHAPKVKNFSDVLRDRELATISLPPAPHLALPAPRVDTNTLNRLRTMTREAAHPSPAPPAPRPLESLPNAPQPAPNMAQPAPPRVQPTPSRTPPPPMADAPTPQAPTRPNFNTGGGSPAEQMHNAMGRDTGGSRVPSMPAAPIRGGNAAGNGMEILSDTQGVDFTRWARRVHSDLDRNWGPLLPDEVYPPLMHTGQTVVQVTILPDGTIQDMKLVGSTHDTPIDKSAWAAIVTETRFPTMPPEFHGPNLIINFHFSVTHDAADAQ